MSASMRRKLLPIFHFLFILWFCSLILNVIGSVSDELHEYFLCRKCGHEIVQLKDLINTPSKLALRQRNDTFGPKKEVLIQLFKNPHGVKFEVITAVEADVKGHGEEIGGDTWWLGYNWRMLICQQCRQHLGWEYLPQNKDDSSLKAFVGLVFGNLLYNKEADDLLVIPKSYSS